MEFMGSAPSTRASSVERERNVVNKESSRSLSKGEVAKVTKLYRRLETDENGTVPLSSVTKLSHFRNNALVKLVARQYARKQDAIGESSSEECVDNGREENPFDLERFIELFDILSPKKNSSSKLKVIFDAMKDKENGLITFQELSNFFRLLLPSTLSQPNIDSIVTNLLHQVHHSSEDNTSSSQQNNISLEDFTKVFVC